MDWHELIPALCAGIALSAACGFRVFVPLLVISIAVRLGGLSVNEHMSWIGSEAALTCLSIATFVEVAAYYIPLIDHALDVINTPLALIAGALITCGMLPDMPDYAQWTVGIIAGAGAAGAVQAGTAALRGVSTVATTALANPVFATLENVLSALGAVIAIVLPVVAVLGLALLGWVAYSLIKRMRRRTCKSFPHS